jgi:hypothetical protein
MAGDFIVVTSPITADLRICPFTLIVSIVVCGRESARIASFFELPKGRRDRLWWAGDIRPVSSGCALTLYYHRRMSDPECCI